MKQRNIHFNAVNTKPSISRILTTPDPTPPTVYYTVEAHASIEYIVNKCPTEIGWLGLVEDVPGGYMITQIYIPEQEVTATTTEIETEGMANLFMHLIEQGVDTSKVRYWGHSHVNMGVSPSTRDEDQIADYLETSPLFIRGIYNKKGVSKVDVFDVTQGFVFECVSTGIHKPISAGMLDYLDAALKSNVKERRYVNEKYPLGPGSFSLGLLTPDTDQRVEQKALTRIRPKDLNIYDVYAKDKNAFIFESELGQHIYYATALFSLPEQKIMKQLLAYDESTIGLPNKAK